MRNFALFGVGVAMLCGAQARADEQVPEDFRFGIGIGIHMAADILEPNVAVASFYYKGVQYQPFVVLSSAVDEVETDDGISSSDDDATAKESGAGLTVKYPFSRRRNVEFQLIGSADYIRTTEMEDPDGPSNRSTAKSKSLTLSYGLGIEWWVSSNVSIAAITTNPLYANVTTKTKEEQVGGTLTTESKSREFGLVWDPEISILVMIWF